MSSWRERVAESWDEDGAIGLGFWFFCAIAGFALGIGFLGLVIAGLALVWRALGVK